MGEEVFREGGVRRYPEIREFLFDINAEIVTVENQARAELEQELNQNLPSSLDLDGVSFNLVNYLDIGLGSLGGGIFELNFLGLAASSSASVEWDTAPWLANGRISIETEYLTASGTYDLFTGNASAVLDPPIYSIDVDYGGLGLVFANFITLGGIDRLVDTLENSLMQQIDESIQGIVDQRLNVFSDSLFGIEPYIPDHVYYHGVDVAQEIRALLDDIPAGNIVRAFYSEGAGKYYSKLTILLGNNVSVVLTHKNPNALCTGSCRGG
ncbi:MAG: hypothetical protein AAGF72_03830 [Pseudomonadota bacterium]